MTHYHPQLNDHGKPVIIDHQSTPTGLDRWANPTEVATVVPEGEMPAELNGIAFQPWHAPTSDKEWASVEGQADIVEPPFAVPPGKKPAAGVVIVEADDRVWLVAPTNAFGGYKNSFPKGRRETGASLQATAIRETFEEAGLKVEITGFLIDLPRSTTRTRYYTARRIAGNPADMELGITGSTSGSALTAGRIPDQPERRAVHQTAGRLTMWIFLSDSMLSVVQKPGDTNAGTLTVRGRIKGDIERAFPDAKVTEGAGTDYRYRVTIPREQVAKAMYDQVMALDYSNFKDTVKDRARHDAYLRCWSAMYALQEAKTLKSQKD